MGSGKRGKSDPNQWRRTAGRAEKYHYKMWLLEHPRLERPFASNYGKAPDSEDASWASLLFELQRGQEVIFGPAFDRFSPQPRTNFIALLILALVVGTTATECMPTQGSVAGNTLPVQLGVDELVTMSSGYGDVRGPTAQRALLAEEGFIRQLKQGEALSREDMFSDEIAFYQELLNKYSDASGQAVIYCMIGDAYFGLRDLRHSYHFLKKANTFMPLSEPFYPKRDFYVLFEQLSTIISKEYLPAYKHFLNENPPAEDYAENIFTASNSEIDFVPITAQEFSEFIKEEGFQLISDQVSEAFVIVTKDREHAVFSAEEVMLLNIADDYGMEDLHMESFETLMQLLNQLRNPLKRVFVYVKLGELSIALNDHLLGYHYFTQANTIMPLFESFFNEGEETSDILFLYDMSKVYASRAFGFYREFLAKNPSEQDYYSTVITTDGTTADRFRRFLQEEGYKAPETPLSKTDYITKGAGHFAKGYVEAALGAGAVGTLVYFAYKQGRKLYIETEKNIRRDAILGQLNLVTTGVVFNDGSWSAERTAEGFVFTLNLKTHKVFSVRPDILESTIIDGMFKILKDIFGENLYIEKGQAKIFVADGHKLILVPEANLNFEKIIFNFLSECVEKQRVEADLEAGKIAKEAVISQIGFHKEAIRKLLEQLNNAFGSLTGAKTILTDLGSAIDADDNAIIDGARALYDRELSIVNVDLPGPVSESGGLADFQREQGEWSRKYGGLAIDIPSRVKALNALREKLTRQGTALRAAQEQEVREEQVRQLADAARERQQQAAITAKITEIKDALFELGKKSEAIYAKVEVERGVASENLEHKDQDVCCSASAVVKLCAAFPSAATGRSWLQKREEQSDESNDLAKLDGLLRQINGQLAALAGAGLVNQIKALADSRQKLDDALSSFAKYEKFQAQSGKAYEVLHPAEFVVLAGPPRPAANGKKVKMTAVAEETAASLPYAKDDRLILTVIGDIIETRIPLFLQRISPGLKQQVSLSSLEQKYKYVLAYNLIRLCRLMNQSLQGKSKLEKLQAFFRRVGNIVMHQHPSVTYYNLYNFCEVLLNQAASIEAILQSKGSVFGVDMQALAGTALLQIKSREREAAQDLQHLLNSYIELIDNQELWGVFIADRNDCFAGLFVLVGECMQHLPNQFLGPLNNFLKDFLAFCKQQVRLPVAHPDAPESGQEPDKQGEFYSLEPADSTVFQQYTKSIPELIAAIHSLAVQNQQPSVRRCRATMFYAGSTEVGNIFLHPTIGWQDVNGLLMSPIHLYVQRNPLITAVTLPIKYSEDGKPKNYTINVARDPQGNIALVPQANEPTDDTGIFGTLCGLCTGQAQAAERGRTLAR